LIVSEGLEKGAYVLKDFGDRPDLILMASGSEVSLIYEAAQKLADEGRSVRVVSFPSWELFEKQDEAYRESVLPKNNQKSLAVEAGAGSGWERYAKSVLSIERFGASAPYKTIFEHLGFTVDNVVTKAGENLMKVAVGCDHAGFPLKNVLLQSVSAAGHEAIDVGTFSSEAVDFPDFTRKVGEKVQSGETERGILICGSGIGACIAANKMKGVYASICHDTYSAAQGVAHDNMNVLCLGGRVIGPELVKALVRAFLNASYIGNSEGGERLARRVAKIVQMEEES
jgi:ribose 5-phosphate isomerase B